MFETYDFDYLMDRMLSNIEDSVDKREGSIIYDALAPAALELSNFYVALDMIVDEMFGDTASYYYLIKRAAERGLTPKQATKAVCKAEISPTTVTLSAGDRFSCGDLNFSVSGAVEGEDGVWKIECETDGTAGNLSTGTLLPIETVEGLETASLTELLIPGEEEEDVETFRTRYYSSFNSKSYGGDREDYITKVNEINGVGGCKVKRAWENGYRPADMIPSSEVKTWFNQQSASTVGTDVYEWISKVYNAANDKLLTTGGTVKLTIIDSQFNVPSSTLVKSVQEEIDPVETAGEGYGTAPVGHVVNVQGVNEVTVNFDFTITYESGVTFTDIQTLIESAVDGKIAELRQSWSTSDNIIVRVSAFEALLLNINGIVDVTGTTINGVAGNLTLDENSIPVRGTVSG